MNKRRVFANAGMSILQTVVTGWVLFFLYRFLLRTIGVEQVGLWSLLLATTSVANIASFGLSGGIVKFVAKYAAREEPGTVSRLIQTAAISLAVFMAVVLAASYPLIKTILSLVVPASSYELAVRLLPWAFLSFWIMLLMGILQAGLDGYQKITVRSTLLMGGTVLHFSLCLILAPRYGLFGVAYSSVIQNLAVLIGCWIMLRHYFRELPLFPREWDRNLLKEILSYGVKFQAITILSMFFEPLTKALLSRFGGLSMLGYYEMAIRLVYKMRELIYSATQTLVPAIADLQERDPGRIHSVYRRAYQVLFFLGLPLFTLLIIGSPLVSRLWIGHYESIFVSFSIILSVSWFINILELPASVAYMGRGELRPLIFGYGAMAVINSALGFILGMAFGGYGVIFGRAVALIVGTAIIYISYQRWNRLPLAGVLPADLSRLSLACLVSFAIFMVLFLTPDLFAEGEALIWVIPFLAGLFIFVPFWRHPTRKWLQEGASDLVLNGRTI